MTLARKLLAIVDETDTFVPLTVRRTVERQERGEPSREGDPVALVEMLTLTRPELRDRIRIVAASGPVV